MARSIAQWRVIIQDKKAAEAALDGVDSTSNVAEWNLWVDIVAFCAAFLEGVLDVFKSDVNLAIAKDKAHTLRWYVTKAKAFQYGVSLPEDSDVYAVVPPEDEGVLIVSSANATEIGTLNRVRLKVAKGEPGALEPLSDTPDPPELTALKEYISKIKDAGVRIDVTTGNADDLRLKLDIYYDPLVIDEDGARLDGTDNEPVKDAVNVFLANLPFDGVFILNDMVDAVEAVEGVKICYVVLAEANYGATPYVPITVKYTPDAGYMAIDEAYFDDEITYIPPGA